MKKLPARYAIIALVCAIMVPIVIFPDKFLPAVSDGLSLFVLNVFPALFPFFFFSTVLSNLNFGYDIGFALKKPLKKLFNAPPLAGYVLIMSMLCGYPIGAKILSDFHEKGLVDKAEAQTIATFTSTSGPLFIIGTVGVTMLNDKTAGFVILISHYISAIINGLIFRARKTENKAFPLAPIIKSDSVLKDSMVSSLLSVAIVGGYIAVFNLVLAITEEAGIITLLSKPFVALGASDEAVRGVLSGFIEITKGCLILSESSLPIQTVAPLCAFVITSGGLSITLQSLTFLGKCKISPWYYLLFKTTQGIICFGICRGIMSIVV